MMENLEKEVERALNYKFLAECFYLPDKKQAEVLNSFNEVIGPRYSEISECLDSNENVETVMIDYAKLFVGPFGQLASPYGSVYLENGDNLMGNSTIDVLKMYAAEGIKVNIKEVPDHIAVELEFMSFLANKKVNSMREMDEKTTAFYDQKQQHFLDIHLGSWIEEFTERVERNSQTEFYRKLAQLTKQFILTDKN